MQKLLTFEDYLKENLKDPEYRKEFESLRPKYEAISKMIQARHKKKITQKQLAQKAKTKQSNISRFEKGKINPTLGFLSKLAKSLGLKMEIKFRPA